MALNSAGNTAPFVEINPGFAAWANQNKGTAYTDPASLYTGAFGPGRVVSGQSLYDRGFSDIALNANYFRPDSGKLNPVGAMPEYDQATWLDYGWALPLAVVGGGLLAGGMAGAGGAAGVAGAGTAGADAAGLAAMGADAGLSGSALDAFVASGGTMGSTAAGGGGVGFGAGELFGSAAGGVYDAAGAFTPGYSPGFTMSGSSGFGIPGAGGAPGSFGGGMASPAGAFGGTGGGGMMELIERLRQLGLMPGGGGPLSTLSNIGSGLYGMYQSNQMKQLAEEAARMQDPFGPHRSQYAGQLSALYADPSRITSMPGYQAGLDAVERKMASQGYLGSGNMMASLQQYGGDFFDKEVARLSNLAGAQFAPSGGNALLAGNIAGNNLMGQSLASLGWGVRGLEGMFPNMFGWGNQPTYGTA